MKVIDDTTDEPRLREAAGIALGYVLADDNLEQVLEKIRQADLDPRTRALYVQALWNHRSPQTAEALVALLEGPPLAAGDEQVRRRRHRRGGRSQRRRRDSWPCSTAPETPAERAALAMLLAGTERGRGQAARYLQERQRDARRDPGALPRLRAVPDPGSVHDRADLPSPNRRQQLRRAETARTWAWDRMIERLKAGWADGPEGLHPREIRALLVQAVRASDQWRTVAADALVGMGEQGALLSLAVRRRALPGSRPGGPATCPG